MHQDQISFQSEKPKRLAALLTILYIAVALFLSFGFKVICYSGQHVAVEPVHNSGLLVEASSDAMSESSLCPQNHIAHRVGKCVDVLISPTEVFRSLGKTSTAKLVPTWTIFAPQLIQLFLMNIVSATAPPSLGLDKLPFESPKLNAALKNIRTVILRI